MNKVFNKIYYYLFLKRNGIKTNPMVILQQLLESQYWSRQRFAEYHIQKFNELFEEVSTKTGFYENLAKMLPISDLDKVTNELHQLTKKDIQENRLSFLNHDLSPKFKHSTSGSTGIPLITEISEKAEVYRLASRARFLQWWGINYFEDKYVYLWAKKKPKNKLLAEIKSTLKHRLILDVFKLDESTIFDYYKKLEKFKPVYIRGYKSGVFQLALLMDKFQLKLKKCNLKVVVVTSELLLESERAFIERVLDCKVANEYGSAEGGQYANECEHGGMHVNEEAIYLTADENNNALSTELFNNGMPLINYKNGDILRISKKKCSCGRNLKLIDVIEGRLNDFIDCTNGTIKNPTIINYIFMDANSIFNNSIYQFRVRQNLKNFTVELIPTSSFNDSTQIFIEKRLYEEVGNDISIHFLFVEHISLEKSGKLRYFINEHRALSFGTDKN